MRWLITLIVLLLIAFAGIYGAGSALPEQIVTIRGAQFATPADKLWKAVSDYAALPEWNDAIASVEAIPDPASDKTQWHITDAYNATSVLDVIETVPPTRLVTELVESDLPWTARWEMELAANERGTWIRHKEITTIPNPAVRFAFYYIIGSDSGIRAYLQSLGHHFGETVAVQELAL